MNTNPDRDTLLDHAADAIRAAACPGNDCPLSEADCSEQRIQPAAWERGVLSEVYGRPEWFADAVLAVLPDPTDRAADEPCAGFPETCPNLRPVLPDPPRHDGGVRCACGEDAVEAHRLAMSAVLGLGTGAPWDAIHDRARELAAASGVLARIREKATEWTALAPPDDWGDTPQDTALADTGRYLLRLIDNPAVATSRGDSVDDDHSCAESGCSGEPGPFAAAEAPTTTKPETEAPSFCDHCKRPGHSFEDCPHADEPATTCTCGVAGDAFVPLGHYPDCPDAAGVRQDGAQPPIPCNASHLRVHHAPHGWKPQPGMEPIRCPGYPAPSKETP